MGKGSIVTWQAIVVVFIASAGTLVVEIIAGRMLAPYMGVNLYTWTSIIGVVLAGISLGNYTGGWLADRYASLHLLALQFFASALATLSILPLLSWVTESGTRWEMPLMLKVVTYVTAIFFLPGFVMGTISPVVVKLSLHDLRRTGKTVGLLYACSTVGSIVGTFLTGFYLISTFGTRAIVIGVAGLLALMGILIGGLGWGASRARGAGQALLLGAGALLLALYLYELNTWTLFQALYWSLAEFMPRENLLLLAPGVRAVIAGVATVLVMLGLFVGNWRSGLRWAGRLAQAVLLLGLGLGFFFIHERDLHKLPFARETDYFTINVTSRTYADGVEGLALVLDHLIHSFSFPNNPRRLEYGYERVYEELTLLKAETHPDMRTAFIGGGGYTFPRYIEAVYPRATIHVVEIDPAVTEIAYERLGLRRDGRVVPFNEDARLFFNEAHYDAPYDIIFGDAFNDLSVPYHLTTAEFAGLVHQALTPDGLYIVNIIDKFQTGEFLRAYMRGLKVHFPHVYLMSLGETWRGNAQNTYIVVAAKRPLDLAAFDAVASRGGRLMLTNVLPQAELDAYLASGLPITLTDDYAPVDQLLAPLFNERGF